MTRYVTKEDGGPWLVLDTHQLTDERLVAGPMSKGDAACVVRELNYLQSTIAALNTDVSNLTQALEDAKSDPESGHARLTERVNTLAAENMVLKNQRETTQHSIRSLGNENSKLKERVESLREEKRTLSEEVVELADRNVLLGQRIAELENKDEQEEPLVFGQDDSGFKTWAVGFEAGVVAAKRAAHRVALDEAEAHGLGWAPREIYIHQGTCHRVAARISKIQITEEQGQ